MLFNYVNILFNRAFDTPPNNSLVHIEHHRDDGRRLERQARLMLLGTNSLVLGGNLLEERCVLHLGVRHAGGVTRRRRQHGQLGLGGRQRRLRMVGGDLRVQRRMPFGGTAHGGGRLLRHRLVAERRPEAVLVGHIVDGADLLQRIDVRVGALDQALAVGDLGVRAIGVPRIAAGRVAEDVRIGRARLLGGGGRRVVVRGREDARDEGEYLELGLGEERELVLINKFECWIPWYPKLSEH